MSSNAKRETPSHSLRPSANLVPHGREGRVCNQSPNRIDQSLCLLSPPPSLIRLREFWRAGFWVHPVSVSQSQSFDACPSLRVMRSFMQCACCWCSVEYVVLLSLCISHAFSFISGYDYPHLSVYVCVCVYVGVCARSYSLR